MSVLKRILVGDRNRVLLIRKGRFERVLEPGEYWVFSFGLEVLSFSVTDLVFENPWADFLVKHHPEIAERLFIAIETNEAQVAGVYLNDRLTRVLAPGKRALYWRGPIDVTADVIDVVEEREVPRAMVNAVARACGPVIYATVEEGRTGLLFVDGRYVRALDPGS